MIALPPPPRAVAVRAALALLATVGIALANLVPAALPWPWLLAFVAPAAVTGLLRRSSVSPWLGLALGGLLQAGAIWLVLLTTGPMSRPAALACTILPPLAFATARGQDTDHALALFLAFCVMLVGIILDDIHWPWVFGYAAAASLALRTSSALSLHGQSRPAKVTATTRPGRPLVSATVTLVLGVLFAMLALERSLGLLPSPAIGGAAPTPRTTEPSRRAGLDDSFVLDGTRGVLSELTGEQLVLVRSPHGPVPRDLYLRSGFFTVPDLDRWQLGRLDLTRASRPDGHLLQPPRPDAALHWLEVERYAGARNFVFVPPGACEIVGLTDLSVDVARGWVRQRGAGSLGTYAVSLQRLPEPVVGDALEPLARRQDLLVLPTGLETDRLRALLDRWQVGSEPISAMERIAAGLARHCRYDRIEPPGPFPHALQNFLFAEGDRRGYCMHFASAAALLLRLCDIPCRIGVGLYGGQPDRRQTGARLYGSQHAHAWVEVPFAGRGFVVFDPTPPSERGQSTPSRPALEDLAAPAAAATPSTRPLAERLADLSQQPWLLTALLAIVVASSWWPARRPQPAATAAATVPKTLRRALGQVLAALARAGHRRQHGETLEGFLRRLRRAGVALPAVEAACLAYQAVRFGGEAWTTQHEQRLLAGLAEAAALPPAQPEPPTASGR
jgi:hypothetical protein